MLKAAKSYEEACRTFRWRIPERYNLAFDVCDRQTMGGADGHRTALIVESAAGTVERYTFHVLRLLSNRLANVLAARGVRPGDRVVVSFPPSVEAAVALLAVLKMGAVAVPVPPGLGEEPLCWRLANAVARAALASPDAARRVLAAGEVVPGPDLVLAPGEAPPGCDEMWGAMQAASDAFSPALCAAEDPAFLFHPSAAGGRPPGVLHAHRALPGCLPAVEFALDFFAQPGDVFWTSAEWMSYEALLWALLPAWHHGVPVVAGPLVAGPSDSDPARALALMARHGVRAAWLPGHDLARLTAAAATAPHPQLRALASGPVPIDDDLRDSARRAFGTVPNTVWGSVECGAAAAGNAQVMEARAGSPGRAAPGVVVEAADPETGRVLPAGQPGILALAPNTPGACLGRWNGAAGPWLPSGWVDSGVTGSRDLDGYLWPAAETLAPGTVRVDGAQVVLAEVEAALATHPLVAEAAVTVVGGQLKAFVAPRPGTSGDADFARALQSLVATRRGAGEVPRRVEFVAALPRGDNGLDREALKSRAVRLDAPDPEDRIR
ncbi:AMP-binding protein [Magnetospirillum sp. UT-4]|uniref:AMP-binding protein n=1 Tax=Magnetospirillum sp. UT-4 TaxID=2681467 RepID=UPI001382B76A|nr:AMP-binding protein [Magnetospirillum sp. UT-4]CAA7618632.1 Acetyl-coenzyme A synthetase [Magnetospirillum sp. UT-4]